MDTSSVHAPDHSQVALFVDYDNLYQTINRQSNGHQYPDEYASEILQELKRYLNDQANAPTAIARAYADFGTLDGDGHFVQRALQLDGVTPHFVSSILEDNAAELQLYLEAAETLQKRPDIDIAAIVTGNRSHLPLVRHIQKQGCQALVVAVRPPSTDDIPPFAEEGVYMSALNLLSTEAREDFDMGPPSSRDSEPVLPDFHDVDDPVARRTIRITEEHFGQYDEVYLTPLLRKLSDLLGPDHDPKSLISTLEEAGAVRLEKRNGYPYDYTVLIVHDEHPDVEEIHAAYYDGNGSLDATDDGETEDDWYPEAEPTPADDTTYDYEDYTDAPSEADPMTDDDKAY